MWSILAVDRYRSSDRRRSGTRLTTHQGFGVALAMPLHRTKPAWWWACRLSVSSAVTCSKSLRHGRGETPTIWNIRPPWRLTVRLGAIVIF